MLFEKIKYSVVVMMLNMGYPIIILGMHRSGTSLVAAALNKLGLFIGENLDENYEAKLFVQMNSWLLTQCGGAWDQPKAFSNLLENTSVRKLSEDYIRHFIETPRGMSYWGVTNYFRFNGFERVKKPWGWKDPRNTFTLPIWRDIFPHARVINVYRHGVDVSYSLVVRQESSLRQALNQHPTRKILYWLYPKRGGFTESVRCFDLLRSFDLWEEYMYESKQQDENCGANAINVRFEDFLENPMLHLRSLVEFCGLSVSDSHLDEVSGIVRKSRAFAFRGNADLKLFARSVDDRLKHWGYSA